MDQLAPVFQWLKRNGFWLISAIVALLLIGGWFLASGQIQEQTTAQVRKLKSSFSDMSSVRSVSAVTEEDGIEESDVALPNAHPNAQTEEKMTEELKETIDAIAQVWQQKRDQQDPLLVFPKDILGAKTFEFFNQGKAAEDFPVDLVSSTTEKTYLRTYREQIPKQVAKIARHLRAYWKYDEKLIEEEIRANTEAQALGNAMGGMMGGMGGMGGMGYGGMGEDVVDLNQNKYAVLWNETNQNLWQRKLIEFRNWDDNIGSTQDPTVSQAYILQQDIWLLEAMFNVIRKLNGEAITSDLAVIKEIDYLAFGREARSKLGELAQADKRLGGAEVPVMGEGMDSMMGPGGDYGAMMGMGGGMGGMGGADPDGFDINGDHSPFHGRYVDTNQEPIAAETVRNIINGEELPEENLELIVAKRVPFRLAVTMDERKINEFLALCANSPFAFEVQQIRINKHDPTTVLEFKGGVEQRKSVSEEMGGMGGMGDYGMMDGMSGYEGGMSGFTQQKLDALESTPVETRLSYDVKVEFYGIVRLYNRVRKDFLLKAVGLEEENPTEDETPLDDGVAVLDRR